MQTDVIQRQYDEVIAPHYDHDPQDVTTRSLDIAIELLRRHESLDSQPIKVLDLGMGTGLFLERLISLAGVEIEPFGLDLSSKMIDAARMKLPRLVAEVDDAANLDCRFNGHRFDIISTHFITGFVPMALLALKIRSKLSVGGYWSFVGGTKGGFPVLQAKAKSKPIQWLFGGQSVNVEELVFNPADREEVIHTMEANGFKIVECETFNPELYFKNFQSFMEFAYWGGWLTPFIESLGLHKSAPVASYADERTVFSDTRPSQHRDRVGSDELTPQPNGSRVLIRRIACESQSSRKSSYRRSMESLFAR